MMESSSVQMSVYIYINRYLWSQLQGFDAKIILFLGRWGEFQEIGKNTSSVTFYNF